MAQQDILLGGTQHELQRQEFLCGAASINMILSFWGKQQLQDDVWWAIQVHTGTQIRPPGAPTDAGSFANQHCETCANGNFDCWYTTPEALAATLNDYSPVLTGAEYHATTDDAFRRIAGCLSGSWAMPAAFTKSANLHWSVAVGYQLNGPGAGTPWKSDSITALYIRDPATADPGSDTMQLVTMEAMKRPLGLLLMAVRCGPRSGSYPIVVEQLTKNKYNRVIAMAQIYVKMYVPWMDWKRWIPRKAPRPLPPPSVS